jgi:hypothetical protein
MQCLGMSFASSLHNFIKKVDPISGNLDVAYDLMKPKTPPSAPGQPNPNDAANAAQSTTDAMRMRRGMLSNIYAGALNQAPVSGKTALGT